MRNTDSTAGVSDVLRLIWARVGNPRQQRRLSANAAALIRMRDAALQVSADALALAERLSVLAAACADARCERCGKPLRVKATGRPPRWCEEDCGRAARRGRIPADAVSRETSNAGG